jgi:hypothetical protein
MAQLGALAGGAVPPVETWESIERIPHPRIRDVATYWEAKRQGRRAPSRRDLDPPFEIRAYIAHLFMLDVVEPGPRFRVRLVGTEVTRAIGGDHTGRFLDAVSPSDHYAELRQEIEDVVFNFVLRYRVSDIGWQGRRFARYHRLMMPLSNDQESVNIVFGVGYAIERPPKGAAVVADEAALPGVAAVAARIVPASAGVSAGAAPFPYYI